MFASELWQNKAKKIVCPQPTNPPNSLSKIKNIQVKKSSGVSSLQFEVQVITRTENSF